MRTFIILLNFLLITLIIFSFLNKTNTLIENLEGCPTDKKNMVYKQKAKTEQLLSEIDSLTNEVNSLKGTVAMNTALTQANKKNSQSAVSGIKDEKDRKMRELDSLE